MSEHDNEPPSSHTHRRPLVLGIGGTTRANSSTERALRASLAAAARQGAATICLAGAQLSFPLYAPESAKRSAPAQHFLDLARRCDGMIIASPGYHGSPSGLIKNALDYIEDLRTDDRPYLTGRSVGCIVCASGWQAVGTTLSMLRTIVHALRGWPTPLGAGFNTLEPTFDMAAVMSESDPHPQLQTVGREVTEFATRHRMCIPCA